MSDVTRILNAIERGDARAADELLPLVYEELRLLAAQKLSHERPGQTLQATALVHEVYLRLIDQTRIDWKGRSHFFAVAAEMIRRILVDHARKRAAAKRGGAAQKVPMREDLAIIHPEQNVDLITLDDALCQLQRLNERQARVVELRFFGGLDVKETAAVLGVSERTVKGDWRVGRAWLRHQLDV